MRHVTRPLVQRARGRAWADAPWRVELPHNWRGPRVEHFPTHPEALARANERAAQDLAGAVSPDRETPHPAAVVIPDSELRGFTPDPLDQATNAAERAARDAPPVITGPEPLVRSLSAVYDQEDM